MDRKAALERLDELGRGLFGLAEETAEERSRQIARALGVEHGLDCAAPEDPDGFMVDLALERRRGQPAVLAAIYAEVARRAGIAMTVFSSHDAWLVGERQGESAILLDPAGRQQDRPGDERLEVRPHCAHELAFTLLDGLRRRFQHAGRRDDERRARELSDALPVVRDLRALTENQRNRGL